MDNRKEELERKRAKLAELRKAREERKGGTTPVMESVGLARSSTAAASVELYCSFDRCLDHSATPFGCR